MESDWESWDCETVHREIDSLLVADAIGLPEVEVRARFGEPDEVVHPGSEKTDAAGKLVFRADTDLSYSRLLPHTCVTISTLSGRVAQISWWPKWRRCPPGSPAGASDVYAPE